MSAEANVALVRRIYDAFNRGDAAALDELVAKPGASSPEVLDGLRAYLDSWRDAVPDLRLELDEVVAADETSVTVRATLRGTQRGAFMGVLPTGEPFALPTTDTFRIVAGRWAA